MSTRILLIDGYNLMHAAGLGQRDYKRGELLRCRTKLLTLLLGRIPRAELQAATLVFDARDPPPDRPAQIVVSGLQVIFANPGGDADVLIKQWLSRHSSPRRVTLVSSDRELQRAARGRGTKFLTSDEFLDELERRRPAHRPRSGHSRMDEENAKPGAHVSDAQTEYWLKEFGEVPVVEDEFELPTEPPDVQEAARIALPSPATQPKQRKAPPREDIKSTGSIDPHDLEVWLTAFGNAAAELTPSPDELRLNDLQRWLDAYQKEEGRS